MPGAERCGSQTVAAGGKPVHTVHRAQAGRSGDGAEDGTVRAPGKRVRHAAASCAGRKARAAHVTIRAERSRVGAEAGRKRAVSEKARGLAGATAAALRL